jgi:uncharacterized protein YdcH (DUF465 family)
MPLSKEQKIVEKLKDRRALRQTLIERRNNLEKRIEAVEEEIHELTNRPVE